MVTVINNPQSPTQAESTNNSWVGLILMLFVLFLILYLGVPYLRNMNQPEKQVEEAKPAETMQAPAPANTETNDTTIQIPDSIDVNINQVSPPTTP